MSIPRSKSEQTKSLSAPPGSAAFSEDLPTLKPAARRDGQAAAEPKSLINLSYNYSQEFADRQPETPFANETRTDDVAKSEAEGELPEKPRSVKKKEKSEQRDKQMLTADRWLVRNGHFPTYIGLYLFSVMVLFRPYEIVPGLGFLSATAVYFAIATLAIYVPSQIVTEGNLTIFSTEVKAILVLALIAVVTMPIAKDPSLAWKHFNDPFIKAVVMFVVLVNVVRTRRRLMGMMWLSFGIGIYLGIAALYLYSKGEFSVEDYRVGVDVGGMFGNPNEMALHFVMMTPIVIALGIASRGAWRLVYFACGALFIAANMVTFSRGGFLGLLACVGVMAWKIGRKYRLNVTIASVLLGAIAIAAAPGNYGLRMLSIFIPGLDPVGSSNQRSELLKLSLLVTARNPWGIGIGNFEIVGVRNLVSHNAFTQVSAELGILGLLAYLIFMVSPFRKLAAIERTLFEKDELNWFYYLSIGLQAGIVGYLVSSFFASVAYNWFIYYLIAYAVAFRRIYSVENGLTGEIKAAPLWDRRPATAT